MTGRHEMQCDSEAEAYYQDGRKRSERGYRRGVSARRQPGVDPRASREVESSDSSVVSIALPAPYNHLFVMPRP